MPTINITAENADTEYAASKEAIRDILYMYFEIAGDCRPIGDWDRADLGRFAPYRYLDIEYEADYCIRSSSEVEFLQQGSAVKLLCQLACVYDQDMCSGATFMRDFCDPDMRERRSDELRECHPELFRIHSAFSGGRVLKNPLLHDAFFAAFHKEGDFYQSLRKVLEEIIIPCLKNLTARS